MSDFSQTTTNDIWNDGKQVTISTKLIPAVGQNAAGIQVSWVLPTKPIAYKGAVVVLNSSPQQAYDQPVDATVYTASTNYGVPNTPNGMIGSSQVIATFYDYFGNDITQTSVTVSNIDPTKIYYASIYICTSVLQYYTVGSHSYPLQAGAIDKGITNYAGSIPAAVSPPLNPVAGQAYFDPSVNAVYVWDSIQLAWVRAPQETVRIGEETPIELCQLFYNSATQTLKFFDGTNLVVASPSNLQVKMGSVWVPYVQTVSVGAGGPLYGQSVSPTVYPIYPVNAPTGTFAFVTYPAQLSAPPVSTLMFNSLGQWFLPTPDMVQVNVAGMWFPISPPGINNFYGQWDPYIPEVGYFFYLTTTKRLMAWMGTGWTAIDTSERGQPTTDKVGIGTQGTSDGRAQMVQTLQNLLGYPGICVELAEGQFDVAIDRALAMFRRSADNAYAHRHVSFTVNGGADGGQQTYYLNDPRDKTDKIVNVLKIHRINQLGISSLSAETGLYAQAFFNQLYQGSNVDVLSIHLMNQLSKTYEKIFAGNLMFTWDEPTRQLIILRRFLQAKERVVLEVTMEREEQELLVDRWSSTWIQDWAQAELMQMLGLIRSKYGTLPGANGGLTLNGDSLLAQASEMKTELRRQITDYEVGNMGAVGNSSLFIG